MTFLLIYPTFNVNVDFHIKKIAYFLKMKN